jgi:FkbM family methyltransferase
MRSYNKILDYIDINKNDVVIDCGANVGNVTSILSSTGASVFAFEPNPYAFDVLRERFNNSPNVLCFNTAISDTYGKSTLYLHRRDKEDHVKWSVGSSLLPFKENVNKCSFVEVETTRLSDFIQTMSRRIKLIKMDIEGSECEVLNDLIDTGVIHSIDLVLVELHVRIGPLVPDIDLLKKRLYYANITNINLDWI